MIPVASPDIGTLYQPVALHSQLVEGVLTLFSSYVLTLDIEGVPVAYKTPKQQQKIPGAGQQQAFAFAQILRTACLRLGGATCLRACGTYIPTDFY